MPEAPASHLTASSVSFPAKAGNPVRRGLPVSTHCLWYWIARSSRAMTAAELDRHLGTDLDDTAGGNLEIVGGIVRGTAERDEQPVLPARHAGMGGRLERPPRQEERGRHDIELPAELAGDRQRLRHVGRFHEAELQRHL